MQFDNLIFQVDFLIAVQLPVNGITISLLHYLASCRDVRVHANSNERKKAPRRRSKHGVGDFRGFCAALKSPI